MMTDIVLLDEMNMRTSNLSLPDDADRAKMIFIWDAEYFKRQNYSLKRLVFIYECLADLGVDVYQGDTLEVLDQLSGQITLFDTHDPARKALNEKICVAHENTHVICHDDFLNLPEGTQPRIGRFFQYWKTAKKYISD